MPVPGNYLAQAVHNNAVWCDTVCRAQGIPGEFHEAIWVNRHPAPPFYPNAVTLTHEPENPTQLAYIDELARRLPGAWGVKDSFAAIDLAPAGFQILFEAKWLFREPELSRPKAKLPGVRWHRLTESAALAAWETAWRGETPGEAEPESTRILHPPLLSNGNVAVIAGDRAGQTIAGVIASRTVDVVGVSNLFVAEQEAEHTRAGCIAVVMELFPGLPLVGYEASRDLVEMQALGFEELGPLRIWLKTKLAD
jgi:hypothetical protein